MPMPVWWAILLVAMVVVSLVLIRMNPPSPRQGIPEEAQAEASDAITPAAHPEVLTRESLLQRDRTLDPTRWDDSPDATDPAPGNSDADGGATDEGGSRAGAVDRDFIESLRRRDSTD
ncbi:MAG: hypothetical protein ACK5LS_13030 [Propioniciclava sp.]